MSHNIEYINTAGLRLDGRRPHEPRRFAVSLGSHREADGSCTLRCGGTLVTAVVFGPRDQASSGTFSGGTRGGGGPTTSSSGEVEATLRCAVAIAATGGARRREAQRSTKAALELGTCVEETLRSVLALSLYPSSHIDIFVEVLQSDGGERAACINAACLALSDASIAMTDTVLAVTVGAIEKRPIVDPTAKELQSQCPHLLAVVAAHHQNPFLPATGSTANTNGSSTTNTTTAQQQTQAAMPAVCVTDDLSAVVASDCVVHMEMDCRVGDDVFTAMAAQAIRTAQALYVHTIAPVMRNRVATQAATRDGGH